MTFDPTEYAKALQRIGAELQSAAEQAASQGDDYTVSRLKAKQQGVDLALTEIARHLCFQAGEQL